MLLKILTFSFHVFFIHKHFYFLFLISFWKGRGGEPGHADGWTKCSVNRTDGRTEKVRQPKQTHKITEIGKTKQRSRLGNGQHQPSPTLTHSHTPLPPINRQQPGRWTDRGLAQQAK